MARSKIKNQFNNISVLLRRNEHVTTDYDVFVITEESLEAARLRAANNSRKYLKNTVEAMASWNDWLDSAKTDCTVLGYTTRQPKTHYKGYFDIERTPVPEIIQRRHAWGAREREIEKALAARRREKDKLLEESEETEENEDVE